MAGTNTEKPTGKSEQKKTVAPTVKENKKIVEKAPVSEEKKTPEKTEEKKPEEKKKIEVKKVKKTSVVVNATNVSISTKYSIAICKFIKKKKIQNAIKDLEEVSKLKKAVPMKGEIPHRKGKIMSGRFPVRAVKEFIILLKSLQGNANQHDLEEPIISEAIANKGTTVYGSLGRVQRKRTNLKIVATEKKLMGKKK